MVGVLLTFSYHFSFFSVFQVAAINGYYLSMEKYSLLFLNSLLKPAEQKADTHLIQR